MPDVFPDFCKTMIFIYLNSYEKKPIWNEAVAILAKMLNNGSLYAFKKSAGRLSISRAFQFEVLFKVFLISFEVTTNCIWSLGKNLKSLGISERSASGSR